MTHRVLALDPNVRYMSLPVLRKIAALAKAGVTICGSKPEHNSSLTGEQAEWDQLVAEVWYSDKQPDCPKKITYASYDNFVNAESPLLPSGLVGPVEIITK